MKIVIEEDYRIYKYFLIGVLIEVLIIGGYFLFK